MEVERLGGLLVVVLPCPLLAPCSEDSVFVVLRAARRCRSSSNLVLAAVVVEVAPAAAAAEGVVDRGGVIPVDFDFAADLGGVTAVVDDAVAAAEEAATEEEAPISRRKRSSSSRVKFRFCTAADRTKIPHFSGHSKYC